MCPAGLNHKDTKAQRRPLSTLESIVEFGLVVVCSSCLCAFVVRSASICWTTLSCRQISGISRGIWRGLCHIDPEMKVSVGFCKISFFVEQELKLLSVPSIIENISHGPLPRFVVLQCQIHAQYRITDPRIILQRDVFHWRMVHRSVLHRGIVQ